MAQFIITTLAYAALYVLLRWKNMLPFQKEAQDMRALAIQFKGMFENVDSELRALRLQIEEAAKRPYFLNRKCGYCKRNPLGHYICEALGGITLKDDCPHDMNEICLHEIKKLGRIFCKGPGFKDCPQASVLSYEDYLLTLQRPGYEGMCQYCMIDKRIIAGGKNLLPD